MLHKSLVSILAGYSEVTSRVKTHPTITTSPEKYAIRPGALDQNERLDDNEVGIVIAIPDQDHENQLDENGPLLTNATAEIRAISRDLSAAWAMRHAIAFNGTDPRNATDGLVTEKNWNTDGKNYIQSIALERDEELRLELKEGSDDAIWIVESQFRIWYRQLTA